jgi:steroid 5-alpha reductase family enzyme
MSVMDALVGNATAVLEPVIADIAGGYTSADWWMCATNAPCNPVALVVAWDIAATVFVWILSVTSGNSSWYDPYWSVAPPIAVGVLTGFAMPEMSLQSGAGWRLVALNGIILAWATRLTLNWWRRLGDELVSHVATKGWTTAADAEEDWRYRQIRTWFGDTLVSPPLFWLLGSLGIIHVLPTTVVALAMLPTIYATGLAGTGPPLDQFTVLDAVGVAVGAWGIYLEMSADRTMDAFLERNSGAEPDCEGKRPTCEEGLWAVSRHPNYVGEMLFWVSLACFGVAAGGERAQWTLIGVVVMVALFTGASIPLMEARQAQRRSGWAEYCASTAVLVPLSPAKLVCLLPGTAAWRNAVKQD